jgi:hypothetical protein
VEGIVEGGAAMNDQELYASFMADEAISFIIRHIPEPPQLGVIAIMQSEAVYDAFFGAYSGEADAATK